jgi:pimeloyl-ACP methyl ester carboxylesterase
MTRILYLHGFASGPSSSKAQYFRKRLSGLEILDLAEGRFEHLTITGQLAVLERAAAGDPVSLIGSSMGGYLAALFAARHLETERIVLLAPAFGFARRWAENLGPDKLDQWRRTSSMDVFHYGENRVCPLRYDLLEDGARYEDYPDFRQPALIFHGAQDDVVPARYSEEFAAGHPNARLEILDSGHELLNVLDYMAQKIQPFLA